MITKVAALILLLLMSGCRAEEKAADCPFPFDPVRTTPISLPKTTDNAFDGLVTVVVLIEKDGSVSAAEIISEKLEPADGRRKKPVNYGEAINNALLQWKFPMSKNRCTKKVVIKFEA